METIYNIDFAILDFIQENLRSPAGDAVMPLASLICEYGAVWILLAIILVIIPKTRKAGFAIGAALILELLVCNVLLKPLVARIRPCDINQAVQLLVPRPTDYSFPSGHSGASFAATAALFGQKNRLWIPSLLLSLLISFSRLYLYVHFPSDVLAGAVIGVIAGLAGSQLINYLDKKVGKSGKWCAPRQADN